MLQYEIGCLVQVTRPRTQKAGGWTWCAYELPTCLDCTPQMQKKQKTKNPKPQHMQTPY